MEEKETIYEGQVLLSWSVEEYEKYDRGPVWFLVAIIVAAIFLLYAVITQNFLFAIIIIMFAVVIGLSALHEPREVPFVITTLGIGIGDKFYPYKTLKAFWVIYEPPDTKKVFFHFKKPPRPHVAVPLHDVNPLEVRQHLLRFLDEDIEEDEEPLSDILGRLFKI